MLSKLTHSSSFLGKRAQSFQSIRTFAAAAGVSPMLKINTGGQMPQIAFGTWKTPPETTALAVETAIMNGYRFIDCANDYNNEDKVGEGLNKILSNYNEYGVKREDLFIQAKLWNSNHRREHVLEDLQATLDDLQLDYVDSFVIHWPQAVPATGTHATLRESGAYPAMFDETKSNSVPRMFPYDKDGYFCSDKESHYIETWEAMQDLVENGKTKSIGVSNFTITQINEIINYSYANGLKYKIPSVNQCECHPYLQQKDMIDYCNSFGIIFQAFSILGSGHTHLGVDSPPAASILPNINGQIPLENELIGEMAKKYGKTNAQIILKWALNRGISFVCKSAHTERIVSNIQLFDWELSEQDMKQFDKLNCSWRHLLWREASNHCDYPFKDCLPYDYKLEKAPLVSSSGTGKEA